MKDKLQFRNEHKYFCSEKDLRVLESRIQDICMLDAHAQAGAYHIRSLYFDTVNLQYFYENENGTDPREKWRIRMYNCDTGYIMLECKSKMKGMTRKRACPITREETRDIISGEWQPDLREMDSLKREFYIKYQTKGLQPSVIVEYTRVPYVYDIGNVRITFDKYLRYSKEFEAFFDKELVMSSVALEGRQILEVKFDELLPDYIKNSLQLGKLIKTACSKYYLCKKNY